MRFSTLPDWLSWLETLHPSSIELGLERLRKVAACLPELEVFREPEGEQGGRQGGTKSERPIKLVTVAGTNGKGSCVATLEQLCLAAGQTVGCYTSPHLIHYNERIRINGEAASDEQIIQAFDQIDRARADISLTYFEFGTLAALLIFARAGLDNVVLEVGLGGRLDAVNLVDADVAVITSIALDHEEWLGDNREAIGREKAGIFRPGKVGICADPETPQSIINIAAELKTELLLAEQDLFCSPGAGGWSWRGLDVDRQPLSYSDLPLPHLPLRSVMAAIQAFVLLGNELPESRLDRLLSGLSLPGRCQRMQWRGRNLLLDVAHNPAAAAYLAQRLRTFASSRTLAVFAVMGDKDYRSMLDSLGDVVDYWYFAALEDNPRAAAPADLLASLQDLGHAGECCDTVAAALDKALAESSEGEQIVVAGSFFTVGAALEELGTGD